MNGIEGEIAGMGLAVPALLLACVIYLLPLKKRPRFGARLILSLAALGGFGWWSSLWIMGGNLMPIVFYCLLFLGMTGMVWIVCDVSATEAVYCAACAYLTQHLAFSVLIVISGGSGRHSDTLDLQITFLGVAFNVVIYLCIFAAAYYVIARRLPQKGHYHVNSFHSLMLMLFTVLSSIVLSHLSTIHFRDEKGMLVFLCRSYDMICCIIALWAQYGKSKELAIQERMLEELELKRQQIQQYESYQENVELINYKCHDLKQQVAALRESKGGLPDEVLSKVEESVMIYDSYVKTGNEALDTILTERNLWCEKNGITMSCMIDGESLRFMDTPDLFAIFGNALTNAIESVSKIAEREKRMISVMAFVRMDVLFIQFENYYESELVWRGELPESTKEQDGSHGYGLKSVKYSVEKYKGCMTIDTEDHIFILRITIPLAHMAKEI